MAISIRLPTAGASYRLAAMLAGLGAGFSMGLILFLCGGLIACFAVLSAQMRQPARAVARAPISAADKAFNARCYPLVDCPLFRITQMDTTCIDPRVEPDPEILPTGDPCPKTPLYPVSFPAVSLGLVPAPADAAPAPQLEK